MDANGKKVLLIVDDSISIRSQVRTVLVKENYIVREAGNEIGMFNTIEEYGLVADLVLMDLSLNSTFGLDLVSKLWSNDKYKNIPVIILTGHADRENVELAKMLNVQGYILKPINWDLLKKRINSILSSEQNING